MDSTMNSAIIGILIPFAGTSLGAACVYAMRGELNHQVQRGLTGFASGVMIAASIWSLLIPAMEESAHLGRFGFVPAVVGFWLGIFLLLALDRLVPHLHMYSEEAEGPHSHLQRTTMLVLAVTLHNIPEGMLCRAPRRSDRYQCRRCPGFVTRHCPSEYARRGHHIHAFEVGRNGIP